MANTFDDITKTGAQTGHQLLKLNELVDNSDLQSLFDASINTKPVSTTQYNSDLFNLSPVEVLTNLQGGWGSSIWDEGEATEDQFKHLLDTRANNLWAIAKLGAGVGKGVATAATTFLDGTLGLVTGLAEMIGTMGQEGVTYNAISKLWDNEFSNAMLEVSNAMEEILPNYQTEEEQLRAWYQNMGTANFWADFIKLIGFTTGAYFSGAAWTKGLSLLKEGVTGAKLGAGSAQMLGAGLSAVNEGRIEANNNSDDWEKMQIAQLDEAFEARRLRATTPEDMAILDANYSAALEDIKNRKDRMGLMDLLLNVPILMADNFLTFGKLYGLGYATAKQVASSKPVEGGLFTRLKLFSKNFGLGIDDAIEKEAVEEAGKLVTKEGGKYAWNKLTAKDALKSGMLNALREGNEEMAQMFISEAAGAGLSLDSPDAYYNALTDPKALQDTKGFIKGITEGFMNSYGDFSKYQDFVMGALTGLLGTPTFGKTLNSGPNTYLGKGKTFGLSGGIFGEFSANKEYNERGQKNVDEVNEYLKNYSSNFQTKARHFAASNAFTDLMNGWALAENAFEYKNALDNEDFSAIDRFAAIGKLQDYKDLINLDFANISDEELEKIATETIDKNTGKPTWANADGSLMSSTEEGRKQMREKLEEKKALILNGIESYEKYLAQMRARTEIQNNDDAIRELTWLRWKLDRFNERGKLLIQENAVGINQVVNSIQSVIDGYLEGISNLESKENLSKEEKDALNEYKDEQKNAQLLQSVLRSIVQGDETTGEIGSRIHATLPEYALPFFLSGDFYQTYVEPLGVTYADFKDTISNLADIDKIHKLSKQFNDRLKYYLDDAQQIKNKPKQPKETTLQPIEKSKQETPLAESVETTTQLGETVATFTAPQTPVDSFTNPTEAKIEGDHAKRDGELLQQHVIQEATDLKDLVSNITDFNSYGNLADLLGAEKVNAVIDDLEKENPNHPAVRARDMQKVLNQLGPILLSNNTFLSYPDLVNLLLDSANKSGTTQEFLDINNPIYGFNNIGKAIGFSDASLNNPDDRVNRTVSLVQQDLANIFSLVKQNLEEVKTLKNTNVDTTPSELPSTGKDENPSNVAVNTPQTLEGPKPILEVQNFITASRQNGVGDSLIIQALTSNGFPIEIAKQLLALNSSNIIYTEESAAVKSTYDAEESGYNYSPVLTTYLTDLSEDLKDNNLPVNQPPYNFFRRNTSEVPIHLLPTERNNTFNYNAWVDSQSWNTPLKESIKIRHKYLTEMGAFKKVDNGEVKVKQKVFFKVIKDVNEEVNHAITGPVLDFVIFLADENGNVIGDMPSLLDSTILQKHPGMREFIEQIRDEFMRQGLPDTYTYSTTSTINKIMVGRPLFQSTNISVREINSNLLIGVYNGTIMRTNSSNTEGSATNNPVLMPLNPKKGLVYLLLPNGRKGSRTGYTPVLCTAPRFNQGTENTEIHKKVLGAFNQLIGVRDYAGLIEAMNTIKALLYLDNIHFNAYNAKGLMSPTNAEGPVLRVVISLKLNGTMIEKVRGGIRPTDPQGSLNSLVLAFSNTPFHIKAKWVNTPQGEMYKEILQTNLPAGTESTVGDWFTFNPIINGVELTGDKIKTTGVNPAPTTKSNNYWVVPIGDTKYEVDTKNYKVLVNNVELAISPITDPQHINNYANALLAAVYSLANQGLERKEDAVRTPYGWYDTANNKLVDEPKQPLGIALGGFKRDDESPSQSLGVTSNIKSDPDVLGMAKLDGDAEEEVTFSELQEAYDAGIVTDIDMSDPNLDEAARVITEYRKSGLKRLVDSKPKVWNQQKELQWLHKVLPLLSSTEHLIIIEGLLKRLGAYGKFLNGKIFLDGLAAQGTTYHEAFHAVSQTLLNDKEREALYSAARQKYTDAKSLIEIEENLAEDFRRYTQLELIPIIGTIARIFRTLKNRMQQLFGKPDIINKLFYDINLGLYSQRAQAEVSIELNMLANGRPTQFYSIYTSSVVGKEFNSKAEAVRAIMQAEEDVTHRVTTTKILSGILYAYSLGDKWYVGHNRDNFYKFMGESIDSLNLGSLPMGISSPELENYAIQLYEKRRYQYDSLTTEEKNYLKNKNISLEEYNNWSTAERKKQFECML